MGLGVDGVDSSRDMVQRCRDNAARRGLQVAVYHQRAENLVLARRYASIDFAGPTFNLLPDDETALRALHVIGEHLVDGGMALIPLWVPEPTPAADLGMPRETEDDGVAPRFTPLSEIYDHDRRTRMTATKYDKATSTGVESADR
jgi:SAM-dependent methyltransferase